MATIVIKTIKPSGGDYTSLSAAEAGEQRDLVALNEIAVLECYSMSDTAAVTFAGWTTDATHYIRVYTPASERHAGEWDGTKYNLALTNAHILTTGQTSLYIKIEGIQFKETATATWSYRACFYTSYNAGHNLEFDRCIFYNVSNGGGQYTVGIELFTSTGAIDVKIQNCAFFRSGTGGLSRGIWNGDASAGTVYTYNNTFKNFDEGIRQDATNTHNVKNCGFANCTTPISGTVTEVTNSTITPTFISGKEFHLDSTDTTWKDAGTDLSADAGVINSLDIDGETRTGTWDIGADEFVAAGGGGINIAGFINSLSTTIPNPILNVNRNIIGSFSGLSSFSSVANLDIKFSSSLSGLSTLSSSLTTNLGIAGSITGLSVYGGTLNFLGLASLSLSLSNNVVTAISTIAHGLVTGDYVDIFGAYQEEYNASFVQVTVIDNTTFTYTIDTSNYTPTSPAKSLTNIIFVPNVVQTIKVIGGDFTSLSSWLAARPTDLVSIDKIYTVLPYGITDTSLATVSGTITDNRHFSRIYIPATERAAGKWDNTKYNLTNTSGNCLFISEPNFRIDGLLQVYKNNDTGDTGAIQIRNNTGLLDIRIDGFIIKSNPSLTAAWQYGLAVYNNTGGGIVRIKRGLAYDIKGTGTNIYGYLINNGGIKVYIGNSEVQNSNVGFSTTSGVTRVINCMTQNCTDGFSGTFEGESDWNLSDIAGDSPGIHSKNGVTPIFIDVVNKDFHLSSSDTVAKGAGVRLALDPIIPISTDLDSEIIKGPWSIGTDWKVSTLPPANTLVSFFDKFDGEIATDTKFNGPHEICIDDRYVYVAQLWGHYVNIFLKNAPYSFINSIGSGVSSTLDGEFNSPAGIAIDSNYLYVTEYGGNRVQLFDADTLSFVSKFGSPGTGQKQFNNVVDIELDPTNNRFFLVDMANNRVQIIQNNSPTFTFLGYLGTGNLGSGNGDMNQPVGIKIQDNYIYVLEKAGARVQIFNLTTLSYVDKFGAGETLADGDLYYPTGIKISNDKIYVVEYGNNRLSIFQGYSPAGTFSGLSSFSSTSSISREIVGNILGTSSMTSFLNIKFKLAGIINGLSSFNANLITQLILSGSIPGVSILNGVLTLSGGSAVSLAGIINALSIMSGSSDISYDIVGAINGLSNLDSSIILSYKLNGSFSGLSSFSSTTSIGRGISGSFSGLSSVLGNVNRDLGIVGNLDGLSTVAGLLNLNYLLSGNISGISSLSSLISVWREINGILNSSSTLGATISLAAFLELIGSILGTSSLSAIPNVLRNISGDIFSVTTLSSSPDLLSLISGNITAISTVTGMSFDVLLGLIGSLNGASDLSALIDLDYILSGNMNSISGGVGILINPSLIGPSKITVTYSKLDKIIFETSNLNNIKINI